MDDPITPPGPAVLCLHVAAWPAVSTSFFGICGAFPNLPFDQDGARADEPVADNALNAFPFLPSGGRVRDHDARPQGGHDDVRASVQVHVHLRQP